MLRVGILNIFWFGLQAANDSIGVDFYHAPTDDVRIRDLIASANLDVIVLVEIVDIQRLEQLIAQLPGKWRLRDASNKPVCSRDPGPGSDNVQRVVLAWNDGAVELVRWDRPIAVGPRAPVVARLRHRIDAFEVTAVGIHPKSGLLRGWEDLSPHAPDHKAGVRRRDYFEHVAAWLASPSAGFEGSCLLLGDFNATQDSPEAESLRSLPGWRWPKPAFLPVTADARTTRTDPEIIDHMVFSPDLIFSDHTVLAFDVMPEFPDGEPHSTVVWKRTTDHRLVRASIRK